MEIIVGHYYFSNLLYFQCQETKNSLSMRGFNRPDFDAEEGPLKGFRNDKCENSAGKIQLEIITFWPRGASFVIYF